MEKEQEPQQFQINVPQEQKPLFANSVQINVTNEEVILQFIYIRPRTTQGALVSEIALAPAHAMRFQKALDETLKKHYTKHLLDK